jgi:hypothetical protein
MGELWKAENAETDTIHECIFKFLNNVDDLSMKYLCAVGEELEENNENMSEYFSMIEVICESRNGISIVAKQNLQDVIKLRQQKRIRGRKTPVPQD